MDTDELADIAKALTAQERRALVPFLTFSDATGRNMRAKGLLNCEDGVWTHTQLGVAVQQYLQSQSHPEDHSHGS